MTSRPAILAICGSQRRASFNRMLMRTAMDALSAHADCTALDWQDIPPFDADALEAQGLPAPVLRVREAIARADGVLLVTPEYNFSLPGMLKNTLVDWIARVQRMNAAG
jgi:chromate reductase